MTKTIQITSEVNNLPNLSSSPASFLISICHIITFLARLTRANTCHTILKFIIFYDFTMSNDIKMMCIKHKDQECRMGDCQFFEILPLGRNWMRVCKLEASKERTHKKEGGQ